ncbi:MAG: phosphatase PAP2 family protein [Opitutaceae bacterium]|jgi:membrane-associated phospholipid phosphatase
MTPLSPTWPELVARRLRAEPVLKGVGTALGMSGFFVLYFAVLNHPVFPVTTMPLTAPDRWIGFQPPALIAYISLWVYVPLLPSLLAERRELFAYARATGVLSVIGLLIFIVWPTTIPRPDIDWSQHPSVAFLKTMDASGNACPSLHVAFAVFTAFWFSRVLVQLEANRIVHTANLLWAAVIIYSTLATKQHVAVDALAGSLLGAAVAIVSLKRLRPTPTSPQSRS